MSIITKIAERIPEALNNAVESASDLVVSPNPNLIAPNPNLITPMDSVVSSLSLGHIAIVFALMAFTGYALWKNRVYFKQLF